MCKLARLIVLALAAAAQAAAQVATPYNLAVTPRLDRTAPRGARVRVQLSPSDTIVGSLLAPLELWSDSVALCLPREATCSDSVRAVPGDTATVPAHRRNGAVVGTRRTVPLARVQALWVYEPPVHSIGLAGIYLGILAGGSIHHPKGEMNGPNAALGALVGALVVWAVAPEPRYWTRLFPVVEGRTVRDR